jgi:putative colanic acid biosysnthesis UDP-glucose lipid carrier transferase
MIVNKRSLFLFRLLSDLLILNVVFIISAALAQSWETLIDRNYMFYLLIGLNISWIFTSAIINFYDDFYSRHFSIQYLNILKNTVIQAVLSIIFIFLVKEDLFTRNFIVYNAILLIIFISLRVIVFRKVLKLLRKRGKNIRKLVIIGFNEVAQNFKEMIESNPDFGYDFTGFISEETTTTTSSGLIGSIDNLENLLVRHNAEEAVIALSNGSGSKLDYIIKICNRLAVKTHIIPDYFNYLSSRFQISSFGNFPIITVRREPLDEIQWRIVKRTFDLVFSFLVIVFILSWLIPIIFVISKLSSKGPVFFIQDRIGTRNRKFSCYKFRTLKFDGIDKNESFKPVVENDPRITSFGKFLRRTNIDELPQFFNVLFGDMSVVGPRPHAIPYDEKYGEIVDEIRLRHNVKPGITGWAQIHGLRGDVADEDENRRRAKKRIEYDLWYIENWSFTLDIQIIFMTVWKMIRGESKGT